jgi:thioredoxin 1
MKTAIKFEASWCGPCKTYTPIWNKVIKNRDDLNFEVVDIDNDPVTASLYNVMSIPTTIIIDEGGNIKKKHTGVLSEKKLEEFFNS